MNSAEFLLRKRRAARISQKLRVLFPRAKIALKYGSRWELLVAVILSAQCTDKMVNKVTTKLFKKYRKLDDYVFAKRAQFERDIHSTGFYKNKAKNILAAAKLVKNRFNSRVPKTMEELLTIPGVARKTANIILSTGYGIVEGIAVDTHVRRLSLKLGLTDHRQPEKIEQDLMMLLPKKEWALFSHRLIHYGREYCPARKHECKDHPLSKIYPPAAGRWPAAK